MFQEENFWFQTLSVLQLENSTKNHSWIGGVSFVKRTCSFFKHSTSVFETMRWSCQISFIPCTPTKARDWFYFIYRRTLCTLFPRQYGTLQQTDTSFFRFDRNKKCRFSIKKVQIVGERNVVLEFINPRHCDVYSLYKNRYYIPSKWGNFQGNYDMWLRHSCSGTLPRAKCSGYHRRCEMPKLEM